MTRKELIRIADHLLLHSPYISDLSLFHGKMGISVGLYMYSAKYGDELMGEFAWELFQQVYEGVHCDMPVGLEHGLAGIGYGTALLHSLGILEGDISGSLAEIDRKIMERDPRRMTDMSLHSGAKGILMYMALRRMSDPELSTFDPQYVAELDAVTGSATTAYTPDMLLNILNEPLFPIDEIAGKPAGIDGGSAYYLVRSFLS